MKILFVQNGILFPADRGGRIRTLNILRYLTGWHDITYLCNAEEKDANYFHQMMSLGLNLDTVPWRRTTASDWRFYWDLACNFTSPLPFTVAKDLNPLMRSRAEQLLREDLYDLVICDFVQMAPIVENLDCCASVLFQHNVESQILERHARCDRNWMRRGVMWHQWNKMRKFEATAGRRFSAVVAVSTEDERIFREEYGWNHVRAIDTGVDVSYFSPNGRTERDGTVLFVASLDWLPNQGGAIYFVEEVWPTIRRINPSARFQIVGRNPGPALARLEQVPGVNVIGNVPDVRPYINEAAVVVVPLLVGGGTRIKIFEAMAMGKPVVSTSVGAEGLRVESGKHIVLADSPMDFATSVNDLLRQPERRRKLGVAARQLVCENFSAETVAHQFDVICRQAVAQTNATSTANC